MPDHSPIPFGQPIITDADRQAVMEVLDGTILTHGPKCQDFEETFASFMGGGISVTTSSCTASLHLYYLYLGIGAGDEVILPAISHVATAHAIEITNAKPIFVDCSIDTGTLDPDLLEQAITDRTKAICVVHFNGIPADMTRIMAVASKHALPVLEDAATALGARWQGKHVGLFGDGAGFSFYPAKHITSGEGGMFCSRHKSAADAIRELRAFSYDRTLNERKLPGIYDVKGLGLNYRMSELQAALGASQIRRVGDFLKARKENFLHYKELLERQVGFRLLESISADGEDSHYCLTVFLDSDMAGHRNDLLERFKDEGIGTSVHYPHPLPRLKYYREKYGYDAALYPCSAAIADGSLNLPTAPHVDRADVEYICQTAIRLFGEVKK